MSEIRQMNLEANREGWVHYSVHLGPNGCYLGADREFLQSKPTLRQFRSEDYQNIGCLPKADLMELCRAQRLYSVCTERISCERYKDFGYPETPSDCLDHILGKTEDTIEFLDYSLEEYKPYFHYPNIAELEARWSSVGRDRKYFEEMAEAPITAGVNIIGRVDSLVIFPDDKLTLYQVCMKGTTVFVQDLFEPQERTKLPIVLLTFSGDQIDYAELWTMRGAPSWLRTECPIPVEYI